MLNFLNSLFWMPWGLFIHDTNYMQMQRFHDISWRSWKDIIARHINVKNLKYKFYSYGSFLFLMWALDAF